MSTQQQARGEVAQILARIQAEYESGVRGLSGLAEGMARHRFITARMESMGHLHAALQAIVGDERAGALLASTLEQIPDPPDPSPTSA